jgi:OmpA-OmpF porin, OOP family
LETVSRRIAWLSIALLALACAKPLPVEPPLAVSPLALGPDEWRVTDQVVVVTDASGTMYARKTFPLAKALTQSFVAAMPEADVRSARPGPYHAGLLSFGGDERITSELAPFQRSALAETAAGLRILGDIDGMGGMTPFRHVFGEIQTELKGKSQVAAVVIFSDGLPDFPERALASAQALAASYAGELCFHAVQTGDDPAGTEFLQTLVGITGCGTYRTGESVRSPAAFMQLTREVFTGRADPVMPDACLDIVRLRGIEFDFDKSDIRPDSAVVLDVAVERLRECPDLRVRIEGHTDWIGTEQYNVGLSLRRAEAVKRYFLGKGIAADRLRTEGFGESRPIASNETREGRQRNRRVELHPLH